MSCFICARLAPKNIYLVIQYVTKNFVHIEKDIKTRLHCVSILDEWKFGTLLVRE